MAKLSNKNEFIIKSKGKHGEFYDYSKVNYMNNNTKVTIICPIHGEFEQIPRSHSSGIGCRLCKFDSYKNTTLNFIKTCKILHNDKYDYDLVNYTGAHNIIKIICPTHGEFEQTSDNHLKGHGCKKCCLDKIKVRQSLLFADRANIVHNKIYDYSLVKYVNTHHKIKILCSIHGVFNTSPSNHLKGRGCPICKESKGEIKIKTLLNENNIKFIKQHKFPKCKNIKPLPFDFYLPDYNTCIEFNGRQHYEPVSHFGGIKTLISTQKRDKIKMEYCLNNNIKLIVIKYNEDIGEILDNLFNSITMIT